MTITLPFFPISYNNQTELGIPRNFPAMLIIIIQRGENTLKYIFLDLRPREWSGKPCHEMSEESSKLTEKSCRSQKVILTEMNRDKWAQVGGTDKQLFMLGDIRNSHTQDFT